MEKLNYLLENFDKALNNPEDLIHSLIFVTDSLKNPVNSWLINLISRFTG